MKYSIIALLSLLTLSSVAQATSLDNTVQGIQGAESNVKGSIADVNRTTQTVFKNMAIVQTGSKIENSGTDQTLVGKMGSSNVEVHMKQAANGQTHVDVTAKDGTFKWNKDVAQKVLSNIIQATG
jgi:hypothetical protein